MRRSGADILHASTAESTWIEEKGRRGVPTGSNGEATGSGSLWDDGTRAKTQRSGTRERVGHVTIDARRSLPVGTGALRPNRSFGKIWQSVPWTDTQARRIHLGGDSRKSKSSPLRLLLTSNPRDAAEESQRAPHLLQQVVHPLPRRLGRRPHLLRLEPERLPRLQSPAVHS